MSLSVRLRGLAVGRSSTSAAASSKSWSALAFAVLFLLVFVIPPFTPQPFPLYPLLRWGDVIDMATPLIMLPAYWLILSIDHIPGRRLTLGFALVGALWVEGQAMHLAANAVGHLVAAGPEAEVASFFDETLSHVMWHGAAIALSALVVLGARPSAGSPTRTARTVLALAAAVYGFAFFLIAVEGQTAALAVAGGILVAALALRGGFRQMVARPLAAAFAAGYVVMIALLATWFVYWGGRLPEFSSLGLIK